MSSIKFSTALGNKLIVYAQAGMLLKVNVQIHSTTATGVYYLQLWDATDVPADAVAVTATNTLVGTTGVAHTLNGFSSFNFDLTNNKSNGDSGAEFKNGCTLGLSSTQFTKTATGSIAVFTAEYETL